jgi:CRISPR-associated protein Cas5h
MMEGFQFEADGNWGHFKKRETGNNPLTHDLITKTALIGMIGAVLGFDRETMLPIFPQLSEDILYGVKLKKSVVKNSWGFTSRSAFKPMEAGTPKYFEFLKNPSFIIAVGLKDNRSKDIFDSFQSAIKQENSVYTPVFGWHNCPANLQFANEGVFQENQGEFETNCFVGKNEHQLTAVTADFRIGFEKIPTYQSDFYNDPESYKEIIYPDANSRLKVSGVYYEYSILKNEATEKWWLI